MSPRWLTDWLPLDPEPRFTLIVTHQQAKWYTHRHHDSSKADHQRPKNGQWPSSWHSPPPPSKQLEESSRSWAHEITQPIKASHITFWGHSCLLRWPTLSAECVSLQINPLLTYHLVSHWIFFYDETLKTWASSRPWVLTEFQSWLSGFEFWHMGSSPDLRCMGRLMLPWAVGECWAIAAQSRHRWQRQNSQTELGPLPQSSWC